MEKVRQPSSMGQGEIEGLMKEMGLNVEAGEELVRSKYTDVRRRTYARLDDKGWISVFMRSRAVDGANGLTCERSEEGCRGTVRVKGEWRERRAISADRTRETIAGLVQLEAAACCWWWAVVEGACRGWALHG